MSRAEKRSAFRRLRFKQLAHDAIAYAPYSSYDHHQQFLVEKRAEFEAHHGESDSSAFPEQAVLCNKCSTKAMVLMDGCMTCLNCGESTCG